MKPYYERAGTPQMIRYEIQGGNLELVKINLMPGDEVIAEAGTMIHKQPQAEWRTTMRFFGQLRSALDARITQFGLKLLWQRIVGRECHLKWTSSGKLSTRTPGTIAAPQRERRQRRQTAREIREGFQEVTNRAVVRNLSLLATTAMILMGAACAPQSDPDRPIVRNVLVISSDDHAAYAMGAYGNGVIRTPNLDRLAGQGILFERAYANCPFCTPSRQSLITGRYPHGCGVTLLQTPLAEEQVTIADYLRESGFKTAAIGKMHFNSDLKHGFEFRIDAKDHDAYLAENPARKPPEEQPYKPVWRPFQVPAGEWLNASRLPGTGYPRPGDPENQGLYDDDFLGTFYVRQAIEFMKANRDDRMCVWLSFYEPHSPFNFPVEFASKYDPSEIELPATGAADARWIPAIFRDLTDEQKRGITASYYNSVEYLDTNVGRMLDALEESGLDESTLVVYVSDHGYLLGHHGRFEKHMMWEEIVKVPMIIRHPQLAPRAESALVEMVDLTPTILDILDVPPLEGVDGRSLVGLLEGHTAEHRDMVFSEYLHDNKAMVRTDRWKYVFTTGKADLSLGYATGQGPSGRDQRLYDLKEDPGEFNDLADSPESASVIRELQERMLDVFLQTDPRASDVPGELTIEEKLEWFLEPPELSLPPGAFVGTE